MEYVYHGTKDTYTDYRKEGKKHMSEMTKNKPENINQKNENKPTKLSNLGPYICVALLVIFGIMAILYMRQNYDNYNSAIKRYRGSITELRIADMQAATLAIATLVVTLAGVTLTVLSILRERKNDAMERKIENQIEKLSAGQNELESYRNKILKAEREIHDIANLASIQYIGEEQRECYFDMINQHINERINDQQGQLLEENYRIILISLLSNLAKHENSVNTRNDYYAQILNHADTIRTSKKATRTETGIAVLEMLHALYQQIKTDIDHNPANASPKIKSASTLLNDCTLILKDLPDTFGHIDNLKGLIHLWSGIAEIRMEDDSIIYQAKKSLEKAILHFDKAIEKNPAKVEFLNHKAVALQQLNDLECSPSRTAEIRELHKTMGTIAPNYLKLKLNKASLLVREIRGQLTLESLNNFPLYYQASLPDLNATLIMETLKKAKEARDLLIEVEIRNPGFANGHYKVIELLTMQIKLLTEIKETSDSELIALAMECLEEEDIQAGIDNSKQEIEKAICSCEKIDGDMLSFLYCKYGYYSLFDTDTEKKQCREIKSQIEKATKKQEN